MFKSKHSGWLSDGTRTPLGGNFLSSLDPSKSISNAFAKADPGPSIGKGLSEVDTFVNREIPGGWTIPAVLAVAYATGYIDPTMFASEAAATAAAEAGAGAIATEAGSAAFFDALATGLSSAEAVNAGLAADAALGGAAAFINPATGLSWEVTGSGLAGNGAQLNEAEFATQSGGGFTAGNALKNVNRARQLANLINPSGGKPDAQQFAQFQAMNQPAQEQFGGLYRMNQNPFAQTQQPTSLQAPMAKTPDFLAQLSEEGKTQPTLADLLRTA